MDVPCVLCWCSGSVLGQSSEVKSSSPTNNEALSMDLFGLRTYDLLRLATHNNSRLSEMDVSIVHNNNNNNNNT